MADKIKRDFIYVAKDDYDSKIRINGEDLAVYSEKKLKDLYPAKDYTVLGETFENKKRDRDNDIGRIELNEKRLNIGKNGSHNKIFKKREAFVEVEGGGFIAILKTRIAAFILLAAAILAIVAGISVAVLLSADKPVDPDEPDPYIEPIDSDVLTVSGIVTFDSVPAEGATLTLQSGNSLIKTTTTGADGKYLFAEVKNASYNVVCSYKNSALSKIATVNNASIVVNFAFESGSDVKAIVKIADDDTPPVSVGGLSDEAMEHSEDKKEVDVTLFAAKLDESSVVAVQKQALTEISGELEKIAYYDFSVLKEVFNNSSLESSEYLKNTKTVLEIAVPYDSSHAVKNSTSVMRAQNGVAERLVRLDEKPTENYTDGTYYVTESYVYIYTDCFSTYCYSIGCADAQQKTMGSDVITFSDTATVNLDTKKISMLYKHDQNSTNDVRLQIYLVGSNGKILIAESGIVPVGYQIETMQVKDDVKNMPSVGTYNGVMVVQYITEGSTTLSTQVELPLTVILTR